MKRNFDFFDFSSGGAVWLRLCLWLALVGTSTLVNAQTNVPTLTSLAPNTAVAGTPGLNVIANGANFNRLTVVRFNNVDRVTTFISTTQLSATLLPEDLQAAGTFLITAFNPNAGGGVSNPLPFTVTQAPPPVPTLISLAPNSATAGSAAFTLTVNGTNFVNTSLVRWNGANRPTTFISATQLTAQIPATDVANAGAANVTVFTPPNTAGAGGGTSNTLPFTITPAANPVPQLRSLNPSTTPAGGPAFTLTATGANFIVGSVVNWNGASRPTTFISSTQLAVQIPASDIQNIGTFSITVFNPPNAGVGGGTSNPLPFTVTQGATPVPTLLSLNPNSATAGGPAFTLTVTGANFINNPVSSTVRWNGVLRPTTFISSTQLSAQISANDIANIGTATVTVFTPANDFGQGGGSSNPLPFTINPPPAPVPTLTALNPSSANAGSPGFTLTVTGTNFLTTSSVRWNGAPRPTMLLSPTQLSVQIPATDVANAGTASVTVVNPPNGSGGGGTSNALPFTITQTPAPLPTLTSINPSSANAGGSGFTLMATGANFQSNSVVRWNNQDRATTFVSATQLLAQVPASDIASAGSANVTVVNPPNAAGGGGTSRAVAFAINQAPNPTPTLTSVTPNPLTAGSQTATLILLGTNFVANSVVRFNGADRQTMFVSATQLTAQIPATDLAQAGTASLAVFNPAPGGGLSNALTININNPAPLITSLIPNSVVAGNGAFTLMVNGNGFVTGSVIRWNGANRPTLYVNGNQLTAQIPAADVQTVGSALITVVNPAPGGGTSPGVPFTITPQPLPPPMLTSVTASAVAQGARQVRLTLIGKNFRPGARVVIGASGANDVLMPAADILVESVNRVNETTIYAIVSAANNANLITRAVDVVNADNTNTSTRGSRTTQPLRVQGGSSLGAPLQINSVMIIHPRNGTIITQNEPLFPEAVLTGAGTGTIIGQWLWDGNVTEQFAINFTAGERRLLRPRNSLPTIYLGPHRIELKITSPNLIQAPPVEVIINNGSWKLLRLMEPNSGAGFVPTQPPTLRWTLVPGAMKYQIGFSTQPFFNTISRWYDVTTATEWQIPADVWATLPEGELWWTARVVETAGNTRQPAPMRRLIRLTADALKPAALGTPSDTTILEWQPIRAAVMYRVTITSDAAGKLVLRRFATANAKLDVKKLFDKFQPGVLYYWRVEAFTLKGRLISTSERYSFVPRAAQSGSVQQVKQMNWQFAWAAQAGAVSGKEAAKEAVQETGKGGPSADGQIADGQVAEVAPVSAPAPLVELAAFAVSAPFGPSGHSVQGGADAVPGAVASGSLALSDATNQTQTNSGQGQNPPTNPSTNPSTTPPSTTQNQDAPPPVTMIEVAQSARLNAQIANRMPLPDQAVTSATPKFQIDFKTPIKVSEVGFQVDDTDYTSLAKITATQIAFEPTIPFSNGQHQLIITVGEEAAGWFFNINVPPGTVEVDPTTKGTDAEQETTSTAAANAEAVASADAAAAQAATPDGAPVPTVEKEFTWESSSNQQNVSGSEQDTHNLSLAMQGRYKNGPWLMEMNGTGLLNSLISPRPRHSLGRFNDYVFHVSREWLPTAPTPGAQPGATGAPVLPKWGVDLRFGMVSPLNFQNAEYISTGFAREGVEAAVRTPGGTFGFYRNTNDKGQGEGFGFGYRQRVNGGSYDAPTFTKDPERFKFRLMWLGANDIGGNPYKTGYDEEGQPITVLDPFATPRTGDSYGGLMSVKLNKDWNWVSEYAITSNNVNRLAPDARRQFGRAWRSGFVGTWHKANISIAFRDVSPNYAIPATASLTQLSASDRRGVDFSISRDTPYGMFSGQYQYLQSDFRYDDRAHIGLNNVNLSWTKQLMQTQTNNSTYSTQLSFGVNTARTTTSNREKQGITGLADQGRDGVTASVTETIQTQQLGTLSLTVGGSRNWFRDTVNERANNLITSLNFSMSWMPTKPWFQWQANVSVNWVAGERFSVGGSRTLTTYIQPTFNWARTGLSLTPLVTINQLSSNMLLFPDLELGTPQRRMTTGDMWMTNHGGRLAWQLPGKFRFNTLSFEGSQAWTRDGLSGFTQRTPRFLFLWTLVQPTKPAPPREEPAPQQQQQQPAAPAEQAPPAKGEES